MMDNLLNSKRSANCSQQLEKTEEKKEEMDTGVGSVVVEEKVEKMECEDEFDDTGLDGASTVSSSLLDSPARRTEVDPPVDPPGNNGNPLPNPEEPLKDPAPVPADPVKGKRKKPGKLKMTNAQRRRCDHFMRRGFSSKEARELARLPVERPYLNKRQRSEEVASPNTSGRSKGPDSKRFRDRGSVGPAPPPAAQVGMISYKEVAQATHIAVTPVGYPATTLTTEQLKAVRINLLNLIINLKTPVIRPKYRNCTFKHGYLILACADKATADWTKKAVGEIQPWEGAQLVAMDLADLPKQVLFLGYFQDSLDFSSEDIIRLVQNQNDDFCTETWRVARRTELSKTIELLIEMDERSAELVAAQHFQLNYTFGKARLRRVTGSTATTDRKDSDAPTGKVLSELVLQPPDRICQESGTVQTGVSSQPPDQTNHAKTGTVQLKSGSNTKHQPLGNSRKATPRTVPQGKGSGSKHQPPAPSKEKNQSNLQGVGRGSVTSRIQPLDDAGVEPPKKLSGTAAGNCRPKPGPSGPATGSSSSQQ